MSRAPAARIDRAQFALAADVAAALLAVSLPWSTSATGILAVLWLVLLLPTLDLPRARAAFGEPAAVLPVLLWGLAILGLLWGDVAWMERLAGVGGYNKLLALPLLILQFRHSPRGHWVLAGFVASAVALAALSWLLVLLPGLPWRGKDPGIPVKDYLSQSAFCMIAGFALLGAAVDLWRRGRVRLAGGAALTAAVLIANIVYVATGRTALVVIPILMLLLAGKAFGWRGMIGAAVIGAALASLAWASSPYLRERVLKVFDEVQAYRTQDAITSSGLRLEFWRKSVGFVAQAPVLGHGTGTMPDRFRRAALEGGGAASVAAVNPHNQYLAVAIELGLVGAAVLVAMWLAHLALFLGGGLPAWTGLVIVVQNMVSGAFNSHLFDFTHGWIYVVGVGVAAGMVLRARAPAAGVPAA